ncbi:MAG: hypothetical protein KG003_03060 [Bacteroidetes bacterium]|nr:hypothetical protein [Bacteroidota bacterium]
MTKRNYGKRWAVANCKKHLGLSGCYRFQELAALITPRRMKKSGSHKSNSMHQPGASILAKWISAYQEANNEKLTLKESSLKPTVSKWAALHRGFEDPKRFKEGLDFVVATHGIIGGSETKNWEGCSILLYERKTQSLFQYIADNRTLGLEEEKKITNKKKDETPLQVDQFFNRNPRPKNIESAQEKRDLQHQIGKLILYAASKAFEKLEAEKKLGRWADKKISLTIAAPFIKKNRTNRIYDAVNMLLNESLKGKSMKFDLPLVPKNGKPFNFSRWELDWYIGRFNSKHEIKHEKANDLKSEINKLSRQVSKNFKQQDKKKGLDLNPSAEKAVPSWTLLSPPKSVKKRNI